ncbi:transcription elongation factor GreA [Sulfurimonas sp. HSL-1716]|uniref:transcription elongation factor GreA n=1 Tax=Hydrocurvibacter sulfurireducens TaxID=3131937 RepID=UPI0031F8BE66
MKEPMTLEGYDLLLEEFKYLLEVEKPRVTHEKQVAAAQGDRSENAEYHAAKEQLRHIDKRLFYLNSMIEKAVVIDPSELDHSRVHFGATVEVENLQDDSSETYTICGVLEAEPENGLISVHSPLAKALIGKSEEEQFFINLPGGKKEYEIVNISYTPLFQLKKNIRTKKDFGFH